MFKEHLGVRIMRILKKAEAEQDDPERALALEMARLSAKEAAKPVKR